MKYDCIKPFLPLVRLHLEEPQRVSRIFHTWLLRTRQIYVALLQQNKVKVLLNHHFVIEFQDKQRKIDFGSSWNVTETTKTTTAVATLSILPVQNLAATQDAFGSRPCSRTFSIFGTRLKHWNMVRIKTCYNLVRVFRLK